MRFTKDVPGASTSISEAFMKDLAAVIAEVKPRRVIETGTYNGLGSTITILKELDKIPNHEYQMQSVEVNPEYYREALVNLKEWVSAKKLKLLNGLSIEGWDRPKMSDGLAPVPEDIYTDYEDLLSYNLEIAFEVPEGYLDFMFRTSFLNAFPLMVLLDSAGHTGDAEFNMMMYFLQRKFLRNVVIALDDTNHRKHYRNAKYIRENSGPPGKGNLFTILVDSKEKFGHLIAIYNANA